MAATGWNGNAAEGEELRGGECEVARVVHLARVRVDGGREASDGERLAVPIDDGAAGCRHDDRLAVLPQGHRCELRPSHDLQPGRPRERSAEQEEEGGGEDTDPPVRGRRFHRPSWMYVVSSG